MRKSALIALASLLAATAAADAQTVHRNMFFNLQGDLFAFSGTPVNPDHMGISAGTASAPYDPDGPLVEFTRDINIQTHLCSTSFEICNATTLIGATIDASSLKGGGALYLGAQSKGGASNGATYLISGKATVGQNSVSAATVGLLEVHNSSNNFLQGSNLGQIKGLEIDDYINVPASCAELDGQNPGLCPGNLWLTAHGNNDGTVRANAAAIQISESSADLGAFQDGIVFTQTSNPLDTILNNTIVDWTNSPVSLHIKGSHSGGAIVVDPGVGIINFSTNLVTSNVSTSGGLAGYKLLGTRASGTAPTIAPNGGNDITSGLGASANLHTTIIAGGTNVEDCASTGCTLLTPNIGVATAISLNKITITQPAIGATLTIPDGTTINTGPGGTLAALAFLSTINNSNWSGIGLALTNLAAQAADTFLINATGGSAAPTAFAAPTTGANGCAANTNALQYNTTTHALLCNSSITAATLGGATFAAPGAIGGTTPAAGSFSSLTLTGAITMGNNSITGLNNLQANTAGGYKLIGGSTSATAPDYTPNANGTTTGIGANASGAMDMIVSGVDVMRFGTGSHVYGVTFGTAAANETGYLCYNAGSTPTNEILLDTVVCLVSLRKFKTDIKSLFPNEALSELMQLSPKWYKWNQKTHPTTDKAEQPGLIAEDVAKVDKRLAAYTAKGELKGVRYDQMSAFLIAAIQAQQKEIVELRSEISTLHKHH